MDSATLLCNDDRCARLAHLSQSWERERMTFMDILYRSVEEAIQDDEAEDAGQLAGDLFMGFCAERGLETKQTQLYQQGVHGAALADIVSTLLTAQNRPWGRPEDCSVGKEPWKSSAFLEASGVRLRQFRIVDRWSPEREAAELHSWKVIGECCAYQMPMTLTVVVLGQGRDGRYHGPLSKGYRSAVGGQLRFRKRDGSPLSGQWEPIFRESYDDTRESWIDGMERDGVLSSVCFDVPIPLPVKEVIGKVRKLAEKKLQKIRETVEVPSPSPSICFSPFGNCQFAETCWQFTKPSQANGFVAIDGA